MPSSPMKEKYAVDEKLHGLWWSDLEVDLEVDLRRRWSLYVIIGPFLNYKRFVG